MKLIVERIGIIRHNANLSARELSKRIGMNDGYINSIESGKSIPSLPALINILEVCDVSFEQFFYDNFKDYSLDKKYLEVLKNMNSDKKKALIDFLIK